jgi:hypothetical protein
MTLARVVSLDDPGENKTELSRYRNHLSLGVYRLYRSVVGWKSPPSLDRLIHMIHSLLR